jgi:hypothetical protein
MSEPVIPFAHRQRLLAAYRIIGPSSAPHRQLDKGFVRSLIKQAGLSSKKHLEKWLTIHRLVDHSPLPPRPGFGLLQSIQGHMQIIIHQWARAHPANNQRKKNILSINLLFLLCLLKHGQKSFDTYAREFPLNVSPVRIGNTLEQFARLMEHSEWGRTAVPIRISSIRPGISPRRSIVRLIQTQARAVSGRASSIKPK